MLAGGNALFDPPCASDGIQFQPCYDSPSQPAMFKTLKSSHTVCRGHETACGATGRRQRNSEVAHHLELGVRPAIGERPARANWEKICKFIWHHSCDKATFSPLERTIQCDIYASSGFNKMQHPHFLVDKLTYCSATNVTRK
jgi:hypothetical protein